MTIAIIPARGGSKRIPKKNVKEFAGKPMIAWSIEAAQASGCFDRIIVSTDDPEIADIASKWNAEVPFLRPPELANDFAGTIPVIKHAIDWLISNGTEPEYICCIYATAPMIQTQDIQEGIDVLSSSDACYAFPVTDFSFPIQRAVRITEDNRVEMLFPGKFETRSQDLEEAWHDAGQFYWGRINAWRREVPFFSRQSIPIPLPRHRVQDIDTPEDWRRAEMMFRFLQSEAK